MKDEKCKTRVASPWLDGVTEAAQYARTRKATMQKYINTGKVISRHRLPDADGKVPRGLLIYAPSIDNLILKQPSGVSVPDLLKA